MLLVGAITNAKTSLHEIPIDKPMCIILGNEKDGLTKECIQHTNLTYTIPMQGMVNSFNLSVSAGISLYDLVRRRRQYIQKRRPRPSSEAKTQSTILSSQHQLKTHQSAFSSLFYLITGSIYAATKLTQPIK